MKKLFAVLLGGRAEGCNTELHDVVFVVGPNLADTYEELKTKWFGSQKRLHIDSSAELKIVDGHEIIITPDKPDNEGKKLFFVNFGGYKEGRFGETHDVGFYIGKTKTEALAKGKKELCQNMHEPHCDDNVPVDDIVEIECVGQHYIQLKPTTAMQEMCVESYYRRLV